ncbi:lysozyme [Erwinia phyllosphaerae]|uniref:lysozyme n=1 Tax=Erwinia phyllosphaerae TaxID=2853256 RepID=UPI001FF00964|nr:lysozyme [Erwinia phyllosphaerae]MBV4366272.1 lysozyme [Erwinia phyllosphaerae]
MEISNRGTELIKRFEGLRLTAYRCSAGVLTIGYGHTRGVKTGDVITGHQADAFLREDLQVAELTVNTNVRTKMTQGQFDALVSFVFHVGTGNFTRSTLLKKLNAGDYAGAAGQFYRWIYADGKPLDGLRRRRTAERELFLS